MPCDRDRVGGGAFESECDVSDVVPRKKKLLVAGGGTGGHLFPGIAVARAFDERGGESVFVGTARGLETRVVPQAGYRLLLVDQVGLKGKGLVGLLKGLLALPRSLFQSWRLLGAERPDVALGVGGYASGPAILVAALRGIPTVLLEPNAVPGLTNRWLGSVARYVLSPYERAADHFSARKLKRIGIPVRAELAQKLAEKSETSRSSGKHVLIFGGSQGARAINDVAMQAVPVLVREHGMTVVHQTGKADVERARAAYAGLGSVTVLEFIDDMAAQYAAADLVVCRAGASTLAELAIVGRPSLLIPLPTAADDHQTKNAESFAQAGAAIMLKQKDLDAAKLCAQIQALMSDPAARTAMSEAARRLGDADAARKIAVICRELAGGVN